MNKKLILAALAVAFAMSGAYASDITGVNPVGGVYTITPEHFSGVGAYRRYDNFKLDNGHVANLEFTRPGAGKTQPTTFVNLVKNGVNINGIVNTTRGGNFYNGHAVFITPGGFVVGSSGVLNVGKLSVATPTATKYEKLFKDRDNQNYGDANFHYEDIGGQISALTQNSKGEAGAANIDVNGKVFARNGVEMTGKTVNIKGAVVNGITTDEDMFQVLSTEDQAKTMFKYLVNTNGLMPQWSGDNESYGNIFVQNDSRILIKSTKGMDVSGTVANGAGNVYLTNKGVDGLKVNGAVEADNLARLYNTSGDLAVSGNGIVQGRGSTVIQNKGANLSLGKNTTVRSYGNIEVINQGAGRLTSLGEIYNGYDPNLRGGDHVVLLNKGAGMTVEGSITSNESNDKGEVAITNYNGDLLVNGTIKNNGNLGIINYGSGATITKNADIKNEGKLKIANTGADGLTVVGKIDNDGETRFYNDNGLLKFGTDSAGTTAAQVTNKNGNLYIASRKEATGIQQASTAVITNENGNLVIRNAGTKSPTAANTRGMDLQGTVSAKNGTIAINNDFGNMYVSSNVSVDGGNLGIINRQRGGEMLLASSGKVNVKDGNANIKNYGLGDMVVNSEITHNGRVNVLANAGALQLGSKVHNNSGVLNDNGGFYSASRLKGTGINVTSEFVVDGNGEVLIKNISGENGLRYNGKINTENNQAALVNKKGDMKVTGEITTTNAPVIISNQGQKLEVYSSAKLNSGKEGKLVNTGTEAAEVSKNANITNIKFYQKVKKAENSKN